MLFLRGVGKGQAMKGCVGSLLTRTRVSPSLSKSTRCTVLMLWLYTKKVPKTFDSCN